MTRFFKFTLISISVLTVVGTIRISGADDRFQKIVLDARSVSFSDSTDNSLEISDSKDRAIGEITCVPGRNGIIGKFQSPSRPISDSSCQALQETSGGDVQVKSANLQ